MPTKSLRQLIQHEVYRIVFLQIGAVIALACVALLISGLTSGLSVLLGGLAYCLPNLLFVWRVFRYAGAQQMTQFIVAFFAGEAIKLVLSAILFLFIVKYLAVSLSSMLVGFMGAIVAFWIICLVHFSKPQTKK